MTNFGWSAWKGHLASWKKYLQQSLEAGFDYVELSLDFPLPLKEDLLKRAVDEAREMGLDVAFHAPWRGLDLATPWEEVREGVVKVIKKAIDLSSKYKAKYLVFHLTTSEKLEDDVKGKVFEAGKKSVMEISKYAKEKRVDVALENTPRLGQPDYFATLHSLTDIEFCFDLGHAVTTFKGRHKLKLNDVNVDEVLEVWRDAIGDRVRCLHVHGVEQEKGKTKSHQMLIYPITKRVAAKAIALMGAEDVTLEIYYNKGKEVEPKELAKEIREIRSWEKVYLKG